MGHYQHAIAPLIPHFNCGFSRYLQNLRFLIRRLHNHRKNHFRTIFKKKNMHQQLSSKLVVVGESSMSKSVNNVNNMDVEYMRKSPVEFLQEQSGLLVQLLRAIKLYHLEEVRKLLPFIDKVHINTPFGPLHITALELACSFPPEKSLPLVKLLLSHGAKASNKDKLGRTALHYACSSGNLELVKLLLDNEAVIDSKYEVNSLSRDLQVSDDLGISKCLPLPECWGRTPLHQAIKGNHKVIVKLLLERGASVNVEDEHGVTPLLLAGAGMKPSTEQDYEEIVSLLVTHNANVNVYNDHTGTSPLHHSVALNSLAATKILLNAGAKLQVGACGQTPIHEAAGKGYCNILALLLSYEDSTINRPDKGGRTALHKAAFAGARDCVRLLIDHGGDLSAETKSHTTVMDAIFSHIPRPLHLMKEILDSKITCNDVSVNDVDFKVTLDFKMLAPRGADQQMSVTSAILSSGNDRQSLEVIQHPLIETFLRLKWEKLRIFFILLVLLHFVFVIALSVYVMLIVHRPSWSEFLIAFSRNILLLSAFTLFAHALIQCLLVPRHYFKQYEMWLNLLCALISFIVAVAGNESLQRTPSGEVKIVPADWVLHCTSIVVLLAWIELMLLIGRFPSYGYYALMFSAVLQNVVKVLLTFVCLVFGFALSFSVQFHAYEQFTDPWRAIVKTTVMMMGEFEYADLFTDKASEDNQDPLRLPATSRLIFLMFIILASIVLMNLMVGLAVNDIQGLQKEGNAKRIAKQATFLSHLEKVLSHKILKSDWFPIGVYGFLNRRRNLDVVLILKPGRKGMNVEVGEKNFAKHLPLDVLESIIEVAVDNNTQSCTLLEDGNEKKFLCEMMTTLKHLEQEVRNIKNILQPVVPARVEDPEINQLLV